MEKFIIGRVDKVDLPLLHIMDLDAKIDTGAYSSAIHYHHAEVLKKGDREILHFTLLDPSHPEHNGKVFEVDHFDQRDIKNSFGDSELRFIIHTEIQIFNRTFYTDISLSNRGNLKYPLLLGRKLLKQGFIVDVSEEYLSFNHKSQKHNA